VYLYYTTAYIMTALHQLLLQYRNSFHKVVPFSTNDIVTQLDLSKNNTSLTEFIFNDIEAFTQYIQNELAKNNARYLIGGYNELREMYKRSALFSFEKNNLNTAANPSNNINEPRRLHLGIDIWGDAYTKIYAPLGGMVHSFTNNNNHGDYGATIILQHQIDTIQFHTLYGHLSLLDIENVREGQVITRGQPFAHFGKPYENGNWPPHLHFQIIDDMEFKEGDYPGVCKASESDKYLSNCPNPNLILNMIAEND
jgi:peptidoglycan LD-endopeptidase LytH